VATTDRRGIFIGAEVYQQAGGTILRDLFDEAEGGFFQDAELLDRLVREKLQAEAAKIEAEGWKWVEIMPAYDYGATASMRRIYPEPLVLDGAAQAKLDELEAEYNALCDQEGELTEANAAAFDTLEAEIE